MALVSALPLLRHSMSSNLLLFDCYLLLGTVRVCAVFNEKYNIGNEVGISKHGLWAAHCHLGNSGTKRPLSRR